MADPDPKFEQWKAMAEIQLKFIEKLGEYKLNAARTELTQAVAENLRTVIRAKRRIVQELEQSFRRLNRMRYLMGQRAELIGKMAGKANMIRRGERLSKELVSRMWQGYGFFEKLVPFEVLEQIMEMEIQSATCSGRNYSYVRDRSTECVDVPDDLQNVFELIEWIRSKRYMPRKGKPAYRQIVKAFSLMAKVAETRTAQLSKDLRQMEKSTYETWKPVELLGIPPSEDIKKIVTAGT